MVELSNQSIAQMLDRQNSTCESSVQKMTKSKYGMLEIFRAAFSRENAVGMMRRLSKKFRALSSDAYLDQFVEEGEPLIQEIRSEEELVKFSRMVDFVNLFRSSQCLKIDFFWNFKRFGTAEEEE